MPVPTEPAEELPDEAVTQLSDALKVCHKVVSDYRAALSGTPASTDPAQAAESAPPVPTD